MLPTTTLRPGLLVSLSTSIRGNVRYTKTVLEAPHVTDDGQELAEWNTQRAIADAAEHEASTTVRNKCSSLIRACCAKSAFGLLCPDSSAADLEAAVKETRRLVDKFNAGSKFAHVSVNVLTGRINPNDVEAIRAIGSELQDLLATMETGLSNLDVKVVRAAATRALDVGRMLSPALQEKVAAAIATARAVATRINKAGEEGAVEIDRVAIAKIAEQRMAFLDLDPVVEASESMVAEPSRSLDLEPDVKPAQSSSLWALPNAIELD